MTVDEGDTRASRIISHTNESEDQVPPAPETSTPDIAVGGDQHRGSGLSSEWYRALQLQPMPILRSPSEENASNTGKEEGELAEGSTGRC